MSSEVENSAREEIPPLEYIRTSTELHLSVPLSTESFATIERFLSSSSPAPRLFVYLPIAVADATTPTSTSTRSAQASMDTYPPDNDGCLAFLQLNNTSGPLCVYTLSPTPKQRQISSDNNNAKKDALLPLQLVTRHCILPAIRSLTHNNQNNISDIPLLEEKIRELDIALAQCRRSTLVQIPHVALTCPPLLISTASSLPPDGKINLDDLSLTPYLDDDTFLNTLQKNVSHWIAEINAVTILPTTTPFPTGDNADLEEIKFWLALESSFKHIRGELSSPPVRLTIQVLKSAKRFLAVLALENNTNLDAAEKTTQECATFLRSYPAQALAAARSWDKLSEAIDGVFESITKVRYCRWYDLERCAKLIEAASDTLGKRVEGLLRDKYKANGIVLMLTFEEFEREVWRPVGEIFERFETRWGVFTDQFLDWGRKRGLENKTPLQIIKEVRLNHLPLLERLSQIHQFRLSHSTLLHVISSVLSTPTSSSIDATILREVEDAPLSLISPLDLLSLTPPSTTAFNAALSAYHRKIDSIESRLARGLRHTLEQSRDAEEMFRAFANFQPLLSRPHVRNSVKEFQLELITTVSAAVQRLQQKFTWKYESSTAREWGHIRGVPPTAGKILWAKQMERQVTTLMGRMSDVLGPDWGQQLEGRTLKRAGDELLSKLDARSFLRNWSLECEKEAAFKSARSKSYIILIVREAKEGKLMMKVNFDTRSESLFRDVRYLQWLGHSNDIPPTLLMLSDEAKSRYPHATTLKSSLRSYHSILTLLPSTLLPLLSPQLRALRDCFSEAFDVVDKSKKRIRIRWESQHMSEWVATVAELVTRFEERVERLTIANSTIESSLKELTTVDYDRGAFEGVLQRIQKTIDELSLAGYANLGYWVGIIEKRLEDVLVTRLEQALAAWVATLEEKDTPEGKVAIPPLQTEILLRHQEISASPSVPILHSLFLSSLHSYIGIVGTLPRPSAVRYDVFDNNTTPTPSSTQSPTFYNLISRLSPQILSQSYIAISSIISSLSHFVSRWLAYQSLWDTRLHDVTSRIDNISTWTKILIETNEARDALDSRAECRSFGPITVTYGGIQNKVNLKYDAWQRDLQSSFANWLGERMGVLHEQMVGGRERLEGMRLGETSGRMTADLVADVTFLQLMRTRLPEWGESVVTYQECESLLRKQRYTFRGDWMETSRLKFQHHHLEQILTKRDKVMAEQTPLLQRRIIAEDKACSKRIETLVGEWNEEKPLRGTFVPQDALDILSRFEFSFTKEQTDFENLIKAKDALHLPPTSATNQTATDGHLLTSSLDELIDLKDVWNGISHPHTQLQSIRLLLFSTVTPRKIRSSLEDLSQHMRGLPNKIRQYDAYTHIQSTIKSYISSCAILTDLKTDALKERHWTSLLSDLNLSATPLSELTLGSLWDCNLPSYKNQISSVLTIAQGEMALEVFLNTVRDTWLKQELQLTLYQNRIRLIRGWDHLFTTLDDHTAGLLHMQSSPYYHSVEDFREQGTLWDERLSKLRDAFDAWIDVQRRWVYLEGIFFGSADIKAQLPAEWSRFKTVDGEFVQLMRRVGQRPYAMEVLTIENLQRGLERLGHLMTVIQRALGEYLERQRSEFSRFYFLGDDDLLEIIGNASGDGEMGKVLGHVGKMFAGIGGARRVDPPDANTTSRFDAMISKDGEVVPLVNPIDVTPQTTVKEWLKQLEQGMHNTLSTNLHTAVNDPTSSTSFPTWASSYPAQIMILATLIDWSDNVTQALSSDSPHESLTEVLSAIESKLSITTTAVLAHLPPHTRKTFEQLITELVHQRDVTRTLLTSNVSDPNDFAWQYHLRFNYEAPNSLTANLSNASFSYGFEYLGIGERLVQTPLTDRCYLTLTQALHFRLGGNPFGPAGTGKTESVKALGAQLGRFVVVMNCDETFDFGAMGRLFCGLCQVGAWGCFDEFNRLEERILSAVSQQILTIQRGLLERQESIELLGRDIKLNPHVGIFVTMNPGYAGRSQLPDNLKTLFRSVAMVVPDRKLIAQVMLYSQGMGSAEVLAGRVVDLFGRCVKEMSEQSHYDFGLRALKTLLVSAGGLKRARLEEIGEDEEDLVTVETDVMIRGACNNVVPKLVAEDRQVFERILSDIFPGSSVATMEDDNLRTALMSICEERSYTPASAWMQKVLQLKQVLEMRHGVMLVGPSGVGKSSALEVLLKALETIDGTKGRMYIIDPKAMDKEGLYGALDGTTMEWTDGIFTGLLRTILSNQKGEVDQRHWIVFDGDVDPEWAENLNSVLDDNKLLTLPSGERLSIPENLRIILEVDSLAHATPATVSRCGMVWFSADTVTTEMCLSHLYHSLLTTPQTAGGGPASSSSSSGAVISPSQSNFLEEIKPLILSEDPHTPSLVADVLSFALNATHIMPPTRDRLLTTLRSLLQRGIAIVMEYDDNHPDFPMTGEHLTKFSRRYLLQSLLWSFAGSATWNTRRSLATLLLQRSNESLPHSSGNDLSDYRIRVHDGNYEPWADSVPRTTIESHKVTATDVIITTTDTIRHSEILNAWLESRHPLILCGPPGSGKTMTLTSVLQNVRNVVLANLNFSSKTTPEIILKTFTQHCTYIRRGNSIILEPLPSLGTSTHLVVFCDEINLPQPDAYGTQRVIMFLRQLVERRGFWRTSDNTWITLRRIQFVGACNPPTDAGRVPLPMRFLRHAPLLLVDFPAKDSLLQIYGTFNGGLLKLFPDLKGMEECLTESMVELYGKCQESFKTSMQPHYFFSPRELSRWVRGIYEAIVEREVLEREELIRIWAHEALRLFNDRLVHEEERRHCDELIDNVAKKYFLGVSFDPKTGPLSRPIFYSTWLSKDNRPVTRSELTEFLTARLRVFYEEELDVPLVVFDEVLEHVLRIDRVIRQPMGHCLLVGDSGAGKTVLSKFVSWMNGLSIFQIKAHSRYGLEEFNEDLRHVMRRVGVDGEKICFIFDEGNALGSGFLEAMNALLASGEVPGLFEGDDYTQLMSACRDAAAREGVIVDNEEELWRRFTSIVQRNLHVVFTMNPSGGEWKNRSTTSPALFNRCVVDWFGTWGLKAMAEVGREFTITLDMGDAEAVGGSWGVGEGEDIMRMVSGAFDDEMTHSLRQAVVAALVDMHNLTKTVAEEMSKQMMCRTYLSPRDYLALIQNFVTCVNQRRSEVEDEQRHVNAGLSKLLQTQETVAELKVNLGVKGKELREKETLANQKLQQMVAEQNEAEKRKDEAERKNIEIEKQQIAINERKDEAQRDLDEAEPALLSAQNSVRSIKKRDLDEVRNLGRPPTNVKLTLELVAWMMNGKKHEWAEIRKMLSKSDFIPSILNFDVDKLTPRLIKTLQDTYIEGNDELNAESVMRASKACGPLYKWAASQIKYSTVANRVKPLRDEVEQLEKEAMEAKTEKNRIEKEVARLELSIARYKSDYATLIRDVEALKAEMTSVSTKVDRAESLIRSLSHENDRWRKSSEGFQSVLRSLVGDGLLMAAFLTYAGFFDFKTRLSLLKRWRTMLDVLGIEYREGLSMVEALSKAGERLKWRGMGLPNDSLSLENGVILERCVRFPLIIDPTGHAIDFMMNKFKDKKVQKTSFLDKAFMKTLAGAVRFGTALLVENVETIDPVLNPILNKEIQRTGGRSLVRIGTEDVDYSPKFFVILTTKDPAVKLTPDLCSRVTLVNFTVTPASLQSQSMSLILKSEKPQIEEQRINLLKLQGEQNVKLRELEEQMLSTISAVEGSILDDDRVVEGMETLMKEGAQVEEQISKSKDVMVEVQRAISKFEPLAESCKKLFVLLEQMRDIHFIYEFGSNTFMNVLKHVLQNTPKKDDESDDQRLSSLTKAIFHELAARVGRGLLSEDKAVFSLLLAKISTDDDTFLSTLDFQTSTREDITNLIETTFGPTFPWQGRGLNSLKSITHIEIDSQTPLLLCSAPGHDVSGRVEAMAREDKSTSLSSVAMGSSEGFASAETYLAAAMKRGSWVMLKNCHLCTDWLKETLTKKLQTMGAGNTNENFRLFITSEIHPKLPTSLLRLADVIVAEAPGGVKATLSRFFSGIAVERFNDPVRNRLYLVLGWVHAVIQERLRYVPTGWTEAYEFTEADATHALDVIDSLLEEVQGASTTTATTTRLLSPDKVPWDAIRSTLCKGVFGGRITTDEDQRVLDHLVESLFMPRCFDVDFALGDGDAAPCLPEGTSMKDCFDWIESLPSYTPPTWIGLDVEAEAVRSRMIAQSIMKKVELVPVDKEEE